VERVRIGVIDMSSDERCKWVKWLSIYN